jgi:carboxyl-terminal processing protease
MVDEKMWALFKRGNKDVFEQIFRTHIKWIIPDLEEPARHDWAIMPIVLKYANAEGVTDFSDGLTPDYPVEDNLLTAKAFGDESDPMLSTALSLIVGGWYTRSLVEEEPKPYIDLENPVKSRKHKLLIPIP